MRGSREISLVPSLHRASTDALITSDSDSNTSKLGFSLMLLSSKPLTLNKALQLPSLRHHSIPNLTKLVKSLSQN